MRTIVCIVAFVVLAGCASIKVPPPRYETGAFPEIGARTTVHVGEVMATRYDFLAQSTAVIRENVPNSVWAGRHALPAGTVLHLGVASGEQVYCEPIHRTGSACLRDTDDDGRFDKAFMFNFYGLLIHAGSFEPVAYTASNRNILDGFKYELIYQGLSNGVVRIAYREYSESLARPAFSQDLTYTVDAAGETPIQFRDVAMTLHALDNNKVEYTVTSGFKGGRDHTP